MFVETENNFLCSRNILKLVETQLASYKSDKICIVSIIGKSKCYDKSSKVALFRQMVGNDMFEDKQELCHDNVS